MLELPRLVVGDRIQNLLSGSAVVVGVTADTTGGVAEVRLEYEDGSVVDYTRSELRKAHLMWPYREWGDTPGKPVEASSLRNQMWELVKVEGPVTKARVFRRLTMAADAEKTAPSFRFDLQSAHDRLKGELNLVQHNIHQVAQRQEIMLIPGQPSVCLRLLGPRDLFEVPLTEVAELVQQLLVVDPQLRERKWELPRAALDRYGLGDLGDRGSEFVKAAIGLLDLP